MMPGMFRGGLVVRAGAAALAGVLFCACGGAPKPTTTTLSTTTSSTTTTTLAPGATTTTTTLAATQVLSGTAPWGPVSSIGRIHRVEVVPVPEGATSLPPVPPGGFPFSSKVVLAFRRFGSGPDLLLVGGEHTTMTTWDPRLLLALGQHYRVTVFDLPGVGYSGPPLGTPDIASFSDDIAALIDAIGLIQPTILGWGLGGEVALALAERHPGLASHLVLADSTPGGPGSTPRAAGVASALDSGSATTAQVAQVLFAASPKAVRSAWLAAVALFAPDDLLPASAAMLAGLQASEWTDPTLAAGLHALALPVLVVHGTADEAFAPADSGALVADIPHAAGLALKGGGYGAIFEDAATFVPDLESFTG